MYIIYVYIEGVVSKKGISYKIRRLRIYGGGRGKLKKNPKKLITLVYQRSYLFFKKKGGGKGKRSKLSWW